MTSGRYAGWNRYIYPKYSFAFSFPPDWNISVEDAHFVALASPTIPEFELHIGFKFTYETEASITRTGIGEGEMLDQGYINFLGKIIPRQVLVYQSEVTTVLYNWACETRGGDMIFTISLDSLDTVQRAIPPKLQTVADQIVESFEWVKLR